MTETAVAISEGRQASPQIEFDEDGFLLDPNHWSMDTARRLAEMYEVGPLGPDHWAIIFYLREHRLSYGSIPPMSQVCRTRGLHSAAVGRLFQGGCLNAWRIAGLPNPGEEAKSYMA